MLNISQLQQHVRTLDKGDENAKRQAIQTLKDQEEGDWASASDDIVESLVEGLQEQLRSETKQIALRQQIVTVLGNLGPRSQAAIPQLVDLLKDGIPDATREAAAIALGKIGKEAKAAVDLLVAMLAHARPGLAVQAVRALGNIGCADQRVNTALLALWQSPTHSQNLKVQVAIALCKLRLDIPGLLRVLTTTMVANQDSALRKSAAEALGWCNKNDLDVVPALLTAALNDKDDKVKAVAEGALTHLKVTHDKAVRLCAKQLKDSTYAEAALRNSGQAAVPALIEALKADEPITREKAARTLGSIGELATEAVPGLTAALKDKDLDARLATAKGLWNVTKNADLVVPVLVHLLEDAASDPGETRRRYLQTVIEALWRIGPPAKGAVQALTRMTKDKNRHISESAINALKEIAPAVAEKAKRH